MDGPILYSVPATMDSFDESGYLAVNPDVSAEVLAGSIESGLDHFKGIGHGENRMQANLHDILEAKTRKLDRLYKDKIIIDPNLERASNGAVDFLPADVAIDAGIVETNMVSSNGYDDYIQNIIDNSPDSWILDAGAGRRDVYYSNVINYEIVPYITTDVIGVVEQMPFEDETFDYVVSNAVLEHVRDPFSAAKEMVRVLKPGGQLLCLVPFLQPYHGYPHHYFNMTKQGLNSLFEHELDITDHSIPHYFHPVWAAAWFLTSWSDGLNRRDKKKFMNMKVKDFINFKVADMNNSVVSSLSVDKQFELASGTFLKATKPPSAPANSVSG